MVALNDEMRDGVDGDERLLKVFFRQSPLDHVLRATRPLMQREVRSEILFDGFSFLLPFSSVDFVVVKTPSEEIQCGFSARKCRCPIIVWDGLSPNGFGMAVKPGGVAARIKCSNRLTRMKSCAKEVLSDFLLVVCLHSLAVSRDARDAARSS